MLGLAENLLTTERVVFVKPRPDFTIVTKTNFPDVLRDIHSLEQLYYHLRVPEGFVFVPRPIDGFTRTLCFQGPDEQNYFFAGFGFGIGTTEVGTEANTYYSSPEYEILYEEINAVRRKVEDRPGLGLGIQIDSEGNVRPHGSPDLLGTIGIERVVEKVRKTAKAKRIFTGSAVVTPEFLVTFSTDDPRMAGYIYRLPGNLVNIPEAFQNSEDILLSYIQQLAFSLKLLHKSHQIHAQPHPGNHYYSLQRIPTMKIPGRLCLTDFSTMSDVSSLSTSDQREPTSLSSRDHLKYIDLHLALNGVISSIPGLLNNTRLLLEISNAYSRGYGSDDISRELLEMVRQESKQMNDTYKSDEFEELSGSLAYLIFRGKKNRKLK